MTEILVRHKVPRVPDVLAAAKARQDAGELVDFDELEQLISSAQSSKYEYETFGDEEYDGLDGRPQRQVDGRTRTRKDDLADLDPDSYEVVDLEKHRRWNRISRIDADIAALRAEKEQLK